jgi:very-short-patch-repair endonuclease
MPRYYDGLDDDGFAITEPYKQPYARGSEADAGEFKPAPLGGLFDSVLARAKAAMDANRTADSPIESILGAAIIICFRDGGRPLTLTPEPTNEAASGLLLVPQFRWSVYRSDWAIYNPKTTGALLIECDGKDFHTSPDQVKHDLRKDQAAHDHGFLTMRFTGSQIHKAADQLAMEIFRFIYGGDNGAH